MTALRQLAVNWLPPAVLGYLRRRRWAGLYLDVGDLSWEQAEARCTGYDACLILDKILQAARKVKDGGAAFERDSVLFSEPEYSWPVLSGLLHAAAQDGGRLSVLDFGGSLGSSYFQYRPLLMGLPELQWNVVEQPHFVEAGRKHLRDGRLEFYENIEECLREHRPNLILLSSVLQYLRRPEATMEQLSDSGAGHLLIDRTPFSREGADRLMIQRVPPEIYPASYPFWVLAWSRFMDQQAVRWRRLATTLSPEGHIHLPRGLRFSFQGVLMERRQ